MSITVVYYKYAFFIFQRLISTIHIFFCTHRTFSITNIYFICFIYNQTTILSHFQTYVYMFPHNLLHHPATFCSTYCVCTSSVLHYIYIKFRARYFHYVSTPMEIPSQNFVSEFHCFFSKEFTQIFDDVTHSLQL